MFPQLLAVAAVLLLAGQKFVLPQFFEQARLPNAKNVMAVIVSILVLAGAMYVILSGRYDDSAQKWAYGAVGTIVGHWFRS
jgi:predicted ABC-type sugar transport system permease subunit